MGYLGGERGVELPSGGLADAQREAVGISQSGAPWKILDAPLLPRIFAEMMPD